MPHFGFPKEVELRSEAPFRRHVCHQSQALTGALTIYQTVSEWVFSEVEQKRRPEVRASGPWTLHTYSAYYYCPGARKDVSPALRITSMLSSAVNSGVVLTARRCPRLAATNAAAPAVALSGAS